MGQMHLRFRETFAVSPEALWEVITDHAGMGRWAKAEVSLIADPGGDGGVGAVREVKTGGLTIGEEVIYADAPRRMVYRIIYGLPVSFHRGELLIEPWGEKGAELTWDILLSSSIPGAATVIKLQLRPGIRAALAKLRTLIEE